MCAKYKSEYFCNKIEEHSGDQKELFRITSNLLHKGKSKPLPSHTDPIQLANEFGEYFISKVSNIRESFPDSDCSPHQYDKMQVPTIESLQPVTEAELRKLIMSSKSKTCSLDPIPTSLLKQCLDCLLPVLVKIVNLSFASCKFPDSLKLAIVIPLLTKMLLDMENKKNYRPVSNLAFLGKTIEKAAVS